MTPVIPEEAELWAEREATDMASRTVSPPPLLLPEPPPPIPWELPGDEVPDTLPEVMRRHLRLVLAVERARQEAADRSLTHTERMEAEHRLMGAQGDYQRHRDALAAGLALAWRMTREDSPAILSGLVGSVPLIEALMERVEQLSQDVVTLARRLAAAGQASRQAAHPAGHKPGRQ